MLPATFLSNVAGHYKKILLVTCCQLLPWCKAPLRTSMTQFVFLWKTIQMSALQNLRFRESLIYLKTQEAYVNQITFLKYPDRVL
jgi:hypothetical protein